MHSISYNFINIMSMDNDTSATHVARDECVIFKPEQYCTYFEFIIIGVISNVVGLIGLIGNLVCIAVLRRPQMRRNSTNVILVALATFDAILIVTSMLMLRSVCYYSLFRIRIVEVEFQCTMLEI